MRDLESARWRTLLVVATAVTGLATACGGGSDTEPERPISTSFYCPGGERSDDCRALADMSGAYCVVQQAREAVRDGHLDVDDLPDWADRSLVDGAPRIVDFRTPPGKRSSDEAADEIDAAMTARGVELDSRAERRCTREITAERVADTEESRG